MGSIETMAGVVVTGALITDVVISGMAHGATSPALCVRRGGRGGNETKVLLGPDPGFN